MPLIDINSKWFNAVSAQMVHFGFGLAAVENLTLVYGHPFRWLSILAGVIAVKEYGWDTFSEHQGFWDNTLDWAVWMTGGTIGKVLAAVVRHVR